MDDFIERTRLVFTANHPGKQSAQTYIILWFKNYS